MVPIRKGKVILKKKKGNKTIKIWRNLPFSIIFEQFS